MTFVVLILNHLAFLSWVELAKVRKDVGEFSGYGGMFLFAFVLDVCGIWALVKIFG